MNKRRCPICKRDIRLKGGEVDYPLTYYRHYLDPQVPAGYGDRCLNSGWPIAHEFRWGPDGVAYCADQGPSDAPAGQ